MDKGTERGRQLAAYPHYLPPIMRPLPKGWKIIKPFHGFIEGSKSHNKVTIEDAEYFLRAFAAGEMDDGVGGAFDTPELEECFRKFFHRRAPHIKKTKFVEVGGCRVSESAKALYRLLYWLKEIHVARGNFYKGTLCRLFHPNERWAITVEFWKYELSLRFYVEADDIKRVKPHSPVQCGIPGAHNGEIQSPKAARDYFRLFRRILGRHTMIYPGNNFEV
ncbi:hypothetical protein AW736_01565 [Termitidicoccus mucosus]|uniref:Uncharacterized protein n=1 Tax=Termitidicoccus mucosus TaxID=1184151 RepID=A0A178IQQ2_9BACT|nr:hypothetical protein AW736_01565 [Opitutaceae bacterium TSB47]